MPLLSFAQEPQTASRAEAPPVEESQILGRGRTETDLYELYPGHLVVVAEVGNAYALTRLELERMTANRYGKLDTTGREEYMARDQERRYQGAMRGVLREWTVLKALVLLAKQAKLKVSPEEVEEAIRKLSDSSREEPGGQSLTDSALVVGLSEEQLRREIEEALLIDKFILGEIDRSLTEADLQAQYDFDPMRYSTPMRYRAQQVFRQVQPEMSRRERKEIRSDFHKLRKRLAKSKGKHFGEIARKESDDPLTRDKDGDMGWVSERVKMDKDLFKAIRRLDVGEISPIVETPLGYHILRLVERREPTGQTFDSSARERVVNDVLTRYKQEFAPLLARNAPFTIRRNMGGLRLVGQPYEPRGKARARGAKAPDASGR